MLTLQYVYWIANKHKTNKKVPEMACNEEEEISSVVREQTLCTWFKTISSSRANKPSESNLVNLNGFKTNLCESRMIGSQLEVQFGCIHKEAVGIFQLEGSFWLEVLIDHIGQ